MKIVSVHSKQNAIRSGDAQITSALTDTGIALSFLTTIRTGDMLVRFEGASLTNVDAGRNVGSAALGAVAGGLLLGPLGALAGGAMGGRKSHTLVLNSPDARVVFEASTAEFQRLLGHGMPSDAQVEIQAERLPELQLRWWVKPTVVFASIALLFALFRPRDEKAPAAAAATMQASAVPTAVKAPSSAPAPTTSAKAAAKAPTKKAAAKPAAKASGQKAAKASVSVSAQGTTAER